MISYFILEDSPPEAQMLRENLDRFPELEYTGHSGEIAEAVKMILEKGPDLIFWDLNLIGGTAFDVLERLEKLGAVLPFCVGESSFANFKMDTYSKYQHLFLDNFTKPFFNSEFDNRIRNIILKMRKHLHQDAAFIHSAREGFIFVKNFETSNSVVKIEMRNMIYLEVDAALVTIYLKENKKIKIEIPLQRLLNLLNTPLLKQVNRNTAVHLVYMEKYEHGHIFMTGLEKSIVVNEGFKRRFEAALNVVNW